MWYPCQHKKKLLDNLYIYISSSLAALSGMVHGRHQITRLNPHSTINTHSTMNRLILNLRSFASSPARPRALLCCRWIFRRIFHGTQYRAYISEISHRGARARLQKQNQNLYFDFCKWGSGLSCDKKIQLLKYF